MLMLMVPNIIWTWHKPNGYDPSGESRILLVFERAGQILSTATILFFNYIDPKCLGTRTAWLAASVLLMFIYECYWIRYFRSKRTMRDFYGPFLGVPVPGASLPVAAFLLLGIYGRSIWLIAASVMLGIGHIGIHIQHMKRVNRD